MKRPAKKAKPFQPFFVEVVWTDACDERGEWDLSDVVAGKGPKLQENRSTGGRLCYVDEVKLILMHDYDAEDNEVGNATVIPTGWISSITTGRGKVLYHR